jgi:hypothetical protein
MTGLPVEVLDAPAKTWQPYPAYKDSGVEWLGEIPAHWGVYRMKFVAPSSSVKFTTKPVERPYIGLEHIESKTGRLLLDIPAENVESTVGVFRKGDILFGKLRPYLAKVVHADFDGVSTTELLVLQPKDETIEALQKLPVHTPCSCTARQTCGTPVELTRSQTSGQRRLAASRAPWPPL